MPRLHRQRAEGKRMKLMKTVFARIWWLGRMTATMMGIAMLLALTVGLASTALAGTGIGARFDLGKINRVNAMSTLVGNVDGPLLTLQNSNDPFIRTFRNVPLSLETRVDAGGHRPPPMQIDSDTLVQSLNADLLDGRGAAEFADGLENGTAVDSDKLDGKDSSAFVSSSFGTAPNANHLDGQDSTRFFSGKTYIIKNEIVGNGPNGLGEVRATCNPGDAVLSGGFTGVSFTTNENGFVTDIVTKSLPESSRTWLVGFANKAFPNGNHSVYAICADFPPLR
jgi:hypothetical protein